MFSLRIVTADHYVSHPISDLDVLQSSQLKVPVIRIFGATPAGQKTCMHVHGVFPYIYVPYDGTQPWNTYLQQFAASLDKAINIASGNSNANTKHVYKINLVSGISMYGYHQKEEPFLKIYFYNPNIIKKVADLLLGGVVFNKVFQPHEAHVPYLLQMFIDYNLYGMNMLNVSHAKFRQCKSDDNVNIKVQEDNESSRSSYRGRNSSENVTFCQSGLDNDMHNRKWDVNMVHQDLLLANSIERQSTCELEVDVVAADILNRKTVDSNVGTNPGLAALWEDEKQRRRNRNESSQLQTDPSQERKSVKMATSEETLKCRLKTIIQFHQFHSQKSLTTDDTVSPASSPYLPHASIVECHSFSSIESSQKTIVFGDEEDEDEEANQNVPAVVNVDCVQQVVESSQSFKEDSSSQPAGSDVTKLLASLLASQGSNLSSQDSHLHNEEDHDSILLSQPASDGDEEEEHEMSQVFSEPNEQHPDNEELNLSELGQSWDGLMVSDFLADSQKAAVPQFDGPIDEKPPEEQPKMRKRLGIRGPVNPSGNNNNPSPSASESQHSNYQSYGSIYQNEPSYMVPSAGMQAYHHHHQNHPSNYPDYDRRWDSIPFREEMAMEQPASHWNHGWSRSLHSARAEPSVYSGGGSVHGNNGSYMTEGFSRPYPNHHHHQQQQPPPPPPPPPPPHSQPQQNVASLNDSSGEQYSSPYPYDMSNMYSPENYSRSRTSADGGHTPDARNSPFAGHLSPSPGYSRDGFESSRSPVPLSGNVGSGMQGSAGALYNQTPPLPHPDESQGSFHKLLTCSDSPKQTPPADVSTHQSLQRSISRCSTHSSESMSMGASTTPDPFKNIVKPVVSEDTSLETFEKLPSMDKVEESAEGRSSVDSSNHPPSETGNASLTPLEGNSSSSSSQKKRVSSHNMSHEDLFGSPSLNSCADLSSSDSFTSAEGSRHPSNMDPTNTGGYMTTGYNTKNSSHAQRCSSVTSEEEAPSYQSLTMPFSGNRGGNRSHSAIASLEQMVSSVGGYDMSGYDYPTYTNRTWQCASPQGPHNVSSLHGIAHGANMPHGPGIPQSLNMLQSPGMPQGHGMSQGSNIPQHNIPQGPSMSQGSNMPHGPGMSQSSNMPQGPGMSQGSNMPQGPGMSQGSNMPQGPGMSQGSNMPQGPGMSQGSNMPQGPGMSQGSNMPQGPGMSQGSNMPQGPGMSQGSNMPQGPGMSQGSNMPQGPGMSQGSNMPQGPGMSQGSNMPQGPGMSQGSNMPQGPGMSQGSNMPQGPGMSQGSNMPQGPGMSQGSNMPQGPGMSQISNMPQGPGMSQPQGPGMSQPPGPGMSQPQGPGISQGSNMPQGPGMSQPQGPGMSQGSNMPQGPGMSQGSNMPQGPGMSQGSNMPQGPGMSQGSNMPQGPGMSQGSNMPQGPGMSQGSNMPQGPGMSQGSNMPQGPGMSQPQGPGMSQPQGPGMSQGSNMPQGPSMSQGPGMTQGSNMTQGAGVPQGSNMPQGTGVSQSSSIPQGPGMTQGSNMPQGPGMTQGSNMPQGPGMTQGSNMPQGPGMTQGSNMPQGPGMTQGSNMPQGPGMTQGSNMPQGPGMTQGSNMPQGPGMTQGSNMPQGPGMTQGSNMPQGPGMTQGSNMPQGPGMTQSSNMQQGPGVSQSTNMPQSSNVPPGPSTSQCSNISQGSSTSQGSSIPPTASLPSGSNVILGPNMPPNQTISQSSNIPSNQNINPGQNMSSGANIPPGSNMPVGASMSPRSNLHPGQNMSPGHGFQGRSHATGHSIPPPPPPPPPLPPMSSAHTLTSHNIPTHNMQSGPNINMSQNQHLTQGRGISQSMSHNLHSSHGMAHNNLTSHPHNMTPQGHNVHPSHNMASSSTLTAPPPSSHTLSTASATGQGHSMSSTHNMLPSQNLSQTHHPMTPGHERPHSYNMTEQQGYQQQDTVPHKQGRLSLKKKRPDPENWPYTGNSYYQQQHQGRTWNHPAGSTGQNYGNPSYWSYMDSYPNTYQSYQPNPKVDKTGVGLMQKPHKMVNPSMPMEKSKRGRKRSSFTMAKCTPAMPLDPQASRYTYTFHVPTPIYKRLKFLQKSSTPEENAVCIVRMHPMDARRYSLLKIGRELVKVPKLEQRDIEKIQKEITATGVYSACSFMGPSEQRGHLVSKGSHLPLTSESTTVDVDCKEVPLGKKLLPLGSKVATKSAPSGFQLEYERMLLQNHPWVSEKTLQSEPKLETLVKCNERPRRMRMRTTAKRKRQSPLKLKDYTDHPFTMEGSIMSSLLSSDDEKFPLPESQKLQPDPSPSPTTTIQLQPLKPSSDGLSDNLVSSKKADNSTSIPIRSTPHVRRSTRPFPKQEIVSSLLASSSHIKTAGSGNENIGKETHPLTQAHPPVTLHNSGPGASSTTTPPPSSCINNSKQVPQTNLQSRPTSCKENKDTVTSSRPDSPDTSRKPVNSCKGQPGFQGSISSSSNSPPPPPSAPPSSGSSAWQSNNVSARLGSGGSQFTHLSANHNTPQHQQRKRKFCPDNGNTYKDAPINFGVMHFNGFYDDDDGVGGDDDDDYVGGDDYDDDDDDDDDDDSFGGSDTCCLVVNKRPRQKSLVVKLEKLNLPNKSVKASEFLASHDTVRRRMCTGRQMSRRIENVGWERIQLANRSKHRRGGLPLITYSSSVGGGNGHLELFTQHTGDLYFERPSVDCFPDEYLGVSITGTMDEAGETGLLMSLEDDGYCRVANTDSSSGEDATISTEEEFELKSRGKNKRKRNLTPNQRLGVAFLTTRHRRKKALPLNHGKLMNSLSLLHQATLAKLTDTPTTYIDASDDLKKSYNDVMSKLAMFSPPVSEKGDTSPPQPLSPEENGVLGMIEGNPDEDGDGNFALDSNDTRSMLTCQTSVDAFYETPLSSVETQRSCESAKSPGLTSLGGSETEQVLPPVEQEEVSENKQPVLSKRGDLPLEKSPYAVRTAVVKLIPRTRSSVKSKTDRKMENGKKSETGHGTSMSPVSGQRFDEFGDVVVDMEHSVQNSVWLNSNDMLPFNPSHSAQPLNTRFRQSLRNLDRGQSPSPRPDPVEGDGCEKSLPGTAFQEELNCDSQGFFDKPLGKLPEGNKKKDDCNHKNESTLVAPSESPVFKRTTRMDKRANVAAGKPNWIAAVHDEESRSSFADSECPVRRDHFLLSLADSQSLQAHDGHQQDEASLSSPQQESAGNQQEARNDNREGGGGDGGDGCLNNQNKRDQSEGADSCSPGFQSADKSIVLRPRDRPPSKDSICHTAASYGLSISQVTDPFCGRPEDISDTPRELGGRILRLQTHLLKDLAAFSSVLDGETLQNWRFILAANHGIIPAEDSVNSLDKLFCDPVVHCNLVGNHQRVLTPCIPPPTRQCVALSQTVLSNSTLLAPQDNLGQKSEAVSILLSNDDSLKNEQQLKQETDDSILSSWPHSPACLNPASPRSTSDLLTIKASQDESQTQDLMEQGSESQTQDLMEQGSESQTQDLMEQGSESQTQDLMEQESKSQTQDLMEKGPKSQTQDLTEKGSESQTKDLMEQESESRTQDILEQGSKSQTQDLSEQGSPLPKAFQIDYLHPGDYQMHSTPLRSKLSSISAPGLTPIAEPQPSTSRAKPEHNHLRRQLANKQMKQWTRAEKAETSQIEGPTPRNTFGFKISQLDIQGTKSSVEVQHLCTMSLEMHMQSRGKKIPDPEVDAIQAVFVAISEDFAPSDHHLFILVIDPKALSKSDQPSTSDGTSPVKGLLHQTGPPKDVEITYVCNELDLISELEGLIKRWDPDILVGYEICKLSWGYLLQRAAQLNIELASRISRIPGSKPAVFNSEDMDINLPGRIVLNLWRIMRHEVNLNIYTMENVIFHVLHQRVPRYSYQSLTTWFNHRTHLYRWKVVDYYLLRTKANLMMIDQLDIIGKTSEFARVFGILFYHVLSRGSQYRVESMMLRIAKPLNFIAASPGVQQRAKMRAPECIPLNLEPKSRFYSHPVAVLDFQSLYPSIMIAYNYCFSTCLGRLENLTTAHEGPIEFGCTNLNVPPSLLEELENHVTISPNEVVFVKEHIRKGIISKMVEDILNTRIMVKNSMKKCKDKALHKMLNARQLGLKFIANFTYGYTGANFSGRMPCIEVADSIVRKARETLEKAIHLIEETPEWGAKVIYGDTDSVFVLLKGRTKEAAIRLGQHMADVITASNPKPVKLKFEKVYLPCVLQTKKRYFGYMYETEDQKEPVFDAKGIETVRRDGCAATSKILERSIKILFTTRDVSRVKDYVLQQLNKILEGKVNLQDFIFAKEYRGLNAYRPNACVPALEIAKKLLRNDRRAEPQSGERVPYVIIYGEPGLPLIQLVRQPWEVLADSTLRLNSAYYITKQILPPLSRIFSLMGVNVFKWYTDMPKVIRYAPAQNTDTKTTISHYFNTLACLVCNSQSQENICRECEAQPQIVAVTISNQLRNLEQIHHNFSQICHSCSGSRESTLSCVSLDCPILHQTHRAEEGLKKVKILQDILANI